MSPKGRGTAVWTLISLATVSFLSIEKSGIASSATPSGCLHVMVLSFIVRTKRVQSRSIAIDEYLFCGYASDMNTNQRQRGRPKKDPARAKGEYLEIRLEAAEKRAFRDAAELAGLDLSAWVRERLRVIARQELEGAGLIVAFLHKETASAGGGSRG